MGVVRNISAVENAIQFTAREGDTLFEEESALFFSVREIDPYTCEVELAVGAEGAETEHYSVEIGDTIKYSGFDIRLMRVDGEDVFFLIHTR